MEFYSHSESQSAANILFNGYFKPSAADLISWKTLICLLQYVQNILSNFCLAPEWAFYLWSL